MVSENGGSGERLDMLCGRFAIAPPHDRLIHAYLPTELVVRTAKDVVGAGSASSRLENLVDLMRQESAAESLGGHAMLNALSAALFTLALRAASEDAHAPRGLLALAESVGYQSVSAFRRVFTEGMGMSPAQWRREGRSAAGEAV